MANTNSKLEIEYRELFGDTVQEMQTTQEIQNDSLDLSQPSPYIYVDSFTTYGEVVLDDPPADINKEMESVKMD